MSEKMNGLSMDIAAAEQEKLREVFPECFVEGLLLGKFSAIDENDREKYLARNHQQPRNRRTVSHQLAEYDVPALADCQKSSAG